MFHTLQSATTTVAALLWSSWKKSRRARCRKRLLATLLNCRSCRPCAIDQGSDYDRGQGMGKGFEPLLARHSVHYVVKYHAVAFLLPSRPILSYRPPRLLCRLNCGALILVCYLVLELITALVAAMSQGWLDNPLMVLYFKLVYLPSAGTPVL